MPRETLSDSFSLTKIVIAIVVVATIMRRGDATIVINISTLCERVFVVLGLLVVGVVFGRLNDGINEIVLEGVHGDRKDKDDKNYLQLWAPVGPRKEKRPHVIQPGHHFSN